MQFQLVTGIPLNKTGHIFPIRLSFIGKRILLPGVKALYKQGFICKGNEHNWKTYIIMGLSYIILGPMHAG